MERTMTAFYPIHEGHSIANLTFLIQLNRSITPAEVEAIQPAIDSLDEELPVRIDLANARIEFQDGHGQTTTEKAGQTRQRLAPNGQPEWQLNACENRILVQCADYHRWHLEWERAKRFLDVVCTPLSAASPSIGIVALIHSVLDCFVFEGDPEAYDCNALFSEHCRYLTPQVDESGPIWHVHQGWIETLEVPIRGRLLQVLNLGTVTDGGRLVTNIDHGMHYQFAMPEPLSTFFGPSARRNPDRFFEDAHRRNRKLLLSSLQPSALERIGLGATSPRKRRILDLEKQAH